MTKKRRTFLLGGLGLATAAVSAGCAALGQTPEPLSKVTLSVEGDDDVCTLLINAKPADGEQIFVQERTTDGEQRTFWFHRDEVADERVRRGSRVVAMAVDLRSNESAELARYKVTDSCKLEPTDYSVVF